LLDVTWSLLIQAYVPPRFWVEALSTTMFLINRLPFIVNDFDSSFFRLFKTQPDYTDLHISRSRNNIEKDIKPLFVTQ